MARGNNGQKLFLGQSDYKAFLDLLGVLTQFELPEMGSQGVV